jgi:hypothetical protein
MIIERAFQGIEPKPSLDEAVKIMDEMDRLINEMKETIDIIKRIVGEESEVETTISCGEAKTPFVPFESFIHSS